MTHCVLKLCWPVSCSWLTAVEWEKGGPGGSSLRVWDAAEAPVHVPKPVVDPLPSDSRFRQDLHALQVRADAASTSFSNAARCRLQALHQNARADKESHVKERAHHES